MYLHWDSLFYDFILLVACIYFLFIYIWYMFNATVRGGCKYIRYQDEMILV